MVGACLLQITKNAQAIVIGIDSVNHNQQNAQFQHRPTVKLWFAEQISQLYKNQPDVSMWQDQQATVDFEQQLAVLSLAGVHPQFASWLSSIADPAIKPADREKLLSDALLGYLSFVAAVPGEGEKWLYGQSRMPLNPASAEWINDWQQAVKNN